MGSIRYALRKCNRLHGVICIAALFLFLGLMIISLSGCALEDFLPFEEDTEFEMPSIAEIEVLNQSGVVVKTKQLKYDKLHGYQLILNVSNNSGSSIALRAELSSINGYMIGNTLTGNILSGQTVDTAVEFLTAEIERSGIDKILDIEFKLAIYDSSNYQKITESDMISIKTSDFGKYTQTVNDIGHTAYELNRVYKEDGEEKVELLFKIVDQGVLEITEDNPTPIVQIYLQNDSARKLTVQMYKAKVNGVEIDTSFALGIMPNKKAVANIVYNPEELKQAGITTFDTVSYQLIIHDDDGKLTEMDRVIVHDLTSKSLSEQPSSN